MILAGRPITALLDSGASRSVLDRRWAASAGLDCPTGQQLAGLTATVSAQTARPLTIRIGDTQLPPISPAVLDLAHLSAAARTRIDLVLGQEAFLHNRVEIDPDRMVVRFCPRQASIVGEDWHHLVRTRDKLFCLEVELGRGLRMPAVVDLGSSIPLYAARKFVDGANLLEGRPHSTSASVGVEGLSVSTVTRLSRLNIGGHQLTEVPLSIPQCWNLDAPIVIGAPLLWRFHSILDLGAGRLRLHPAAGFDAPFVADRSGLHVVAGPDCLEIIHISPGSPAAASGLQVGDAIVTVDDEPITARFLAENRNLGRRPTGMSYRIGVRGKPPHLLTLADYY
ncbi:aspartyl protease family protein [Sphingosinicella sp. BN140058]|uniref:aspartyl protease family protein n=1 Tax=Sphingosinicella sp. BN140058 TaxID=1892855 RepID=UPI0013EC18DF|nr:aspartyl protease family protein [Sphingosinicella sp. BN140058]